jgi:catechol 2,3-dioxygenase-like lactoylglutathione lyase family enzyme
MNHVALEVGSVDEALEFYGRLFDVELRGRMPGAAFVDMGDQFLALMEGGSAAPDRLRHLGLVVDDRDAVLVAAREAGVEVFGGNSFLDPWGNQLQVVAYADIQFTKAPEVLRGMGLEVAKSEAALAELRAKGLA